MISKFKQANSGYTEVFSWGSDKHGQLGLGKSVSGGKQYHLIPRFCSYNITISQISCGSNHSIFITSIIFSFKYL